jgi:hypothetical protein
MRGVLSAEKTRHVHRDLVVRPRSYSFENTRGNALSSPGSPCRTTASHYRNPRPDDRGRCCARAPPPRSEVGHSATTTRCGVSNLSLRGPAVASRSRPQPRGGSRDVRAWMSEPAGEACDRAEQLAGPLTTAPCLGHHPRRVRGRSALFERQMCAVSAPRIGGRVGRISRLPKTWPNPSYPPRRSERLIRGGVRDERIVS